MGGSAEAGAEVFEFAFLVRGERAESPGGNLVQKNVQLGAGLGFAGGRKRFRPGFGFEVGGRGVSLHLYVSVARACICPI